MFASAFFNGLGVIGITMLKYIYGADGVKEMKEYDEETYKSKGSLAFGIILIGMMIGVFLIENNIYLVGLMFDCVVFGIWTYIVREKITPFIIICLLLIAAGIAINIIL